MRKLIISLLLFLPLYIIKAQGLSVGTVNAGISGAEMRTVLNTNFSNIKTAVDLKAPLTGSAPGLTVGNVSWIHRDGNSLVSFGTYGGVPGYGSYQFYTPSTGGSNYFYLPLSGTVVMTDPQDTVHFFRGVRLKFPGGHLGWNNSRLGKGWLTDLDVTNTITGSISGNAATVTGFSRGTGSLTLSGNHALTLTTTAATNVTLPTTGTLMTNPMSASGDLLYGGASGVPTRLQAGTNGHVLTLSSGVPSWQEPAAGGLDEQAVIGIVEGVLEDALEDAPIGVAVEDVVGGTTGRDRYMSPAQIESYVAQHGGGGSFSGGERIKFTVGDPGAPVADDSTFIHTALADKQIDLFRNGVKSEYTYSGDTITVDPDWQTAENVELWLWPANTWEYLELETSIEAGLISSLVGYWKLDSTAVDEMENSNGTIYGGTWVAGVINNGFEVSSASDAIYIPSNKDNLIDGPFSISFWVNLDEIASVRETDVSLFNLMRTESPNSTHELYVPQSGTHQDNFYFAARNEAGNWFSAISVTAVTANTWYHIVAANGGNGEYLDIYINGVRDNKTDQAFTGDMRPADQRYVIGSNFTGSTQYGAGIYDEVMIFHRVLSASEVEYLYNDGDGRQLTIP